MRFTGTGNTFCASRDTNPDEWTETGVCVFDLRSKQTVGDPESDRAVCFSVLREDTFARILEQTGHYLCAGCPNPALGTDRLIQDVRGTL